MFWVFPLCTVIYSSRFRLYMEICFWVQNTNQGNTSWPRGLDLQTLVQQLHLSGCWQEGASGRDAVWSLLNYNLELWLRETGVIMY